MFVTSMLTMASVGAFLAVRKAGSPNILGGTLTFYMVDTAAMVFRPRIPLTRLFDVSALHVAMAITFVEFT